MPAGRPIVNHPEDYCHRCLGPNLSWWIDSDVWNDIMRPPGQETWLWSEIICPACFAELFEAKYGGASFELRLSHETRGARAFAARERTDTRRSELEEFARDGQQLGTFYDGTDTRGGD